MGWGFLAGAIASVGSSGLFAFWGAVGNLPQKILLLST
jgi:hypothetical protein